MPWANFDDKFPRHPKVRRLSDGAFRVQVSGICHSAEWRLDGVLPANEVVDLHPKHRDRYVEELVEKGLWVDLGGQFQIHDYLDWNRSRAQIEETEEKARKRQQKWRDAHRNEDGTYRD